MPVGIAIISVGGMRGEKEHALCHFWHLERERRGVRGISYADIYGMQNARKVRDWELPK
jgi:hypothetical protein